MTPFIATSSSWPASPAAGRLPSDPYYKLARQAEMVAGVEAATSAIDKHALPRAGELEYPGLDAEGLRQAEAITAKPLAMLDEVSKPLRLMEKVSRVARQVVGTSTAVEAEQLRASIPAPLPSQYERVVERAPPFAPSPPTSRAAPAATPTAAPGRALDPIVLSQQERAEAWLATCVPAAEVELKLAMRRFEEAADAIGPEQAAVLAQGLNSLRRAVKMLADYLHPAAASPFEDRFGVERKNNDSAYISRIGLALQDASDSSGRFEFDEAELKLFHARLTRLVERFGSGIHGDGDFEECHMLHVDTWRIVACARSYGAGPEPRQSLS